MSICKSVEICIPAKKTLILKKPAHSFATKQEDFNPTQCLGKSCCRSVSGLFGRDNNKRETNHGAIGHATSKKQFAKLDRNLSKSYLRGRDQSDDKSTSCSCSGFNFGDYGSHAFDPLQKKF